jgi:hypothetical protein
LGYRYWKLACTFSWIGGVRFEDAGIFVKKRKKIKRKTIKIGDWKVVYPLEKKLVERDFFVPLFVCLTCLFIYSHAFTMISDLEKTLKFMIKSFDLFFNPTLFAFL